MKTPNAKISELLKRQDINFNPRATRNEEAVRENNSSPDPRPPFSRDGDKILHSWSFTRYTGKTQVFFTSSFDMMSSRIIHVQLVSKIARYIGRVLGFNQDLIEAIALGHDIGHPPFGHVGEEILSEISHDCGIGHYWHNAQAIRWLHDIESHNLTLQTLDGILCHNGESRSFEVTQAQPKTFADLYQEREAIQATSSKMALNALAPATPEGCIVRLCDVIGYIGRDIEDAIVMKVLSRDEIPREIAEVLGTSNKEIVNTLVYDLLNCFVEDFPALVGFSGDPKTQEVIEGKSVRFHFSPEIREVTGNLMTFNYEQIYMKRDFDVLKASIRAKMDTLFEQFMDDLRGNRKSSPIFTDHLEFTRQYLASRDKSTDYGKGDRPEIIVRDFIAGMTERYFDDLYAQCQKRVNI